MVVDFSSFFFVAPEDFVVVSSSEMMRSEIPDSSFWLSLWSLYSLSSTAKEIMIARTDAERITRRIISTAEGFFFSGVCGASWATSSTTRLFGTA